MHGIKWNFPNSIGKGGTTTTESVASELLYKQRHQEILISEVPEWFRDVLRQNILQTLQIIRSFNSILQVSSCY